MSRDTRPLGDVPGVSPENAAPWWSAGLAALLAATDAEDGGLPEALAIWCRALPADALRLGRLDEQGHWARWLDGLPPDTAWRPLPPAAASMGDLPALAQCLNEGGALLLSDTAAPPMDLAADATIWNATGAQTVAIAVLPRSDGVAGILAALFASPREWTSAQQLRLAQLAHFAALTLQRLALRDRLRGIEQRFWLVQQAANDGLWEFDVASRRTRFSPRWMQILGYDRVDAADGVPHWRSLVHPDDLAKVQNRIREHVDGRSPLFQSVHRMRHANGDWRWVNSRAKASLDAHGRLQHLVGMESDITERKLFEEALFREKESAQITLRSIGDGVITVDESCHVQYLNPVAEELTGWNVDEAVGRPIAEVFRGKHEETGEDLENPLQLAVRRNRNVKSLRPVMLLRRDGQQLFVEHNASPRRDAHDKVTGGVLVFHDVSEARELNRRLSYHASHDLLTGLVNRREFEQRLERALLAARTRGTPYALCHLNLDQFRQVNDACGHSAGDAVLGQIGALLMSKVHLRDSVARLGGDEFGILFENRAPHDAVAAAEDLRRVIVETRFAWEEHSFRLGLSIGVVPILPQSDDVPALLAAAYGACLVAKEAGGNRVHNIAEDDMELRLRQREMQWAARLNLALEQNRFELWRQWIQPLSDEGEPGDHYELLLRMVDEQGALISAGQFVGAAERYGIASALDRWVVRHVLEWLAADHTERGRLALCSINLSAQSLIDERFLPFVVEQFARTGMDATKICFEITETAAMSEYARANTFISALKELGCRFALDDFGAGWSSFGYLKHLPVDFLKIDGIFVRNILNDPIDREMVRSIHEIGHLTGKRTIAEFAENPQIIAMLRSLGVDYAQGYGVQQPQRVPI